MKIIVTGGAGFIGSRLIRHLVLHRGIQVLNVDALTYAGHVASLGNAYLSGLHHFERIDIANAERIAGLVADFRPDAVIHLAAESHVDRSVDGPDTFVRTNITGTFSLLEACRRYWERLPAAERAAFRFVHVSTDEVYGSLGEEGTFHETTPYAPSSPYSASKAASDHLVSAWHHTYGLPTIITHCSNNYGPNQLPEKLIPLMILNAIGGRGLPIYGTGENVRDWIHVDDHVEGLFAALSSGEAGATYNFGGEAERSNLDVVNTICAVLDEEKPLLNGARYAQQIEFVVDRPGHDFRYAICIDRSRQALGWEPQRSFESGIRDTVRWYLDNLDWCERVGADGISRYRAGLSRAGRQAA